MSAVQEMSNAWVMVDGKFKQLTVAELKEQNEQAEKAEAERIAKGGCSHPIENWEHDYDEDTVLGDAYYCGLCGDLMQVG
jgi:hypothetical protein